MKTYMAKNGEVAKKWYIVDATDKIVGRLATEIAMILMGKHRPEYTPHVDCGDFVVVINAEKVRVTGANKMAQRTYEHFTGYPGGRRVFNMKEIMATNPGMIVSESVRRMLPTNKLGKAMFKKLKVYTGNEHPHQAQQPEVLEL